MPAQPEPDPGWWRVRWPTGPGVTYFRDRDAAMMLRLVLGERLHAQGVQHVAELPHG